MRLQDYLTNNYGYSKEVNDNWAKYIRLWKSWYRGKVKSFHSYNIYNGRSNIRMNRKSLQMAKKCCEDWADLLFNERCKISLEDTASNDQLNEILVENDFWSMINESIERAGATGTGAIVTSVRDIIVNNDTNVIDVTEAKTKIEYIDIEQIYPISWENKKIKECAFCADKIIRGKKYVYLTVHRLNDIGNYVIENKVFLNTNGNLTELSIQDSAFEVFDTGSNLPWFAIIRPAQSNNIDSSLPWGIPHFANAIDVLQAIDIGFDSFVNEVSLSRKRIFVREQLMQYDTTGEYRVFDENDVAVYCLPNGMNKEDLIQSENSEIRAESLIEYMKTVLSSFSSLVGFGRDRYTFDPVSLTTATQVVSQNSEMYRRKKKNEIPLESALFDIIQSIAYASTAFGTYNINTDGLVIQFDDSIIEDTDAISDRALRELSAGVLSPVEYRTNIYGETKEIAQSMIKDIKENYPRITDLIGD